MNKTTFPRKPGTVVQVSELQVHFPVHKGVFGAIAGYVKAVDGVSFSIKRGDIFALVGESGCGKTTTAQAIAGLIPATSGSVSLSFDNGNTKTFSWSSTSALDRRIIRQKMQMIFQDPYSSLNPRMTVRSIVEEPLLIHRLGDRSERARRVTDLLSQVGLAEEYLNRFPHEFSGGQRQRIGIARALATGPELIIADEPVSALDVSIQAQIINLLQDLRSSLHQTQLFISHDLAVIRHIADHIAVMYQGRIVEYGNESDIFNYPKHPYTHLLLESVPIPGKGRKKRGGSSGFEIAPREVLHGCSFFPRCPRRQDECRLTSPKLREVKHGSGVACFNPADS
jgi:oligopeptide/dipeptide ABC transporter ATP-binding protein